MFLACPLDVSGAVLYQSAAMHAWPIAFCPQLHHANPDLLIFFIFSVCGLRSQYSPWITLLMHTMHNMCRCQLLLIDLRHRYPRCGICLYGYFNASQNPLPRDSPSMIVYRLGRKQNSRAVARA